MQYASTNQPKTDRAPIHKITEKIYDAHGKLRTTSATGKVRLLDYSIIESNWTQTEFDLRGNIIRIFYFDSDTSTMPTFVTTCTYNASGQKTSEIDRFNSAYRLPLKIKTWQYDDLGRLQQYRQGNIFIAPDPVNDQMDWITETYLYSLNGELVSKQIYDTLVQRPRCDSVVYTYDYYSDGTVSSCSEINSNSITTRFYDQLGVLTHRDVRSNKTPT